MTDNMDWRKASYSGSQGGECVEVGVCGDGTILVRDTKDHGLVHRYSPAEWRTFIVGVRDGKLNLGA